MDWCNTFFFLSAENTWEKLTGIVGGDPPGCLQEHTMIGYRDTLYVFGGEVGFSNGVETPLWLYHIKVRKRNGNQKLTKTYQMLTTISNFDRES